MYSKILVVLLLVFLSEISSALLPSTQSKIIKNPGLSQQNAPQATIPKITPLTKESCQSQTINPQSAVSGNNKVNSVPIQPAITQKSPANKQEPTVNNKDGKNKPVPISTLPPSSKTGTINLQTNNNVSKSITTSPSAVTVEEKETTIEDESSADEHVTMNQVQKTSLKPTPINTDINKLQVIKPATNVQTPIAPAESLKKEIVNGQAKNSPLESKDSLTSDGPNDDGDEEYDDEEYDDEEYDDEEDEPTKGHQITASPVQKTPLKPTPTVTNINKVQVIKPEPKVQIPSAPTESLKKESINEQLKNSQSKMPSSSVKSDDEEDEFDEEYESEEYESPEGEQITGNVNQPVTMKNGVSSTQIKPKPSANVNTLGSSSPVSTVPGIAKVVSEIPLPNNLSDNKDNVREDDQDDFEDDYYDYVNDEESFEDDTVIESPNQGISTVTNNGVDKVQANVLPPTNPEISTEPQASENEEEWIDNNNQDDYYPNSEVEDQQSSTSYQNDDGEWFTESSDINKEPTNNNYETSDDDVFSNEQSVDASVLDPTEQWTNTDQQSYEQENTRNSQQNIDDSHFTDVNELENKNSIIHGYEKAKNVINILRDYANLAFDWVVKSINHKIKIMDQLS